jgi:rod shape-determining protein MreD
MDWTKQLGRYVVVMLLQILLFNQLQLWGVCHPYIYIMCLLMLPITLPHSVDMLIGAVIGLIMDVFCNSMGIHIAACIMIMFIRPYLLGVLVNDKERLNEQIHLRSIGMEALIKYTVILVVIHHLMVFSLAAWSWHHWFFVLMETIVSSIVTISIIIGYNALRYR